MKVLECHSKGDIRYSAFGAKIKVAGVFASIEHHYQFSKRVYGQAPPQVIDEFKGKPITHFMIGTKMFPKEFLTQYFNLLWVKYFDVNPELLKIASDYDDFRDIFKGKKTINCQADAIRDIVKLGRNTVYNQCSDLLTLLKSKDNLLVLEKSLLESTQDILGHQVNCQGAMNSGVAREVRETDENIYRQYKLFCDTQNDKSKLLGECQIVKSNGKYIANLFGQCHYGREAIRYTDYDALRKSLSLLKEYATVNKLSVSIPFNMGCVLGGGSWEVVSGTIAEIFNDYPIMLYKKTK